VVTPFGERCHRSVTIGSYDEISARGNCVTFVTTKRSGVYGQTTVRIASAGLTKGVLWRVQIARRAANSLIWFAAYAQTWRELPPVEHTIEGLSCRTTITSLSF
jgi:hypothetical protein